MVRADQVSALRLARPAGTPLMLVPGKAAGRLVARAEMPQAGPWKGCPILRAPSTGAVRGALVLHSANAWALATFPCQASPGGVPTDELRPFGLCMTVLRRHSHLQAYQQHSLCMSAATLGADALIW